MSFAVKLDESLRLPTSISCVTQDMKRIASISRDCQEQLTSKYGNAFVLTIASSSPSISTFPIYADIRQVPIPVSF